MEYMTIQKNLKSSPRKLRLVADMVRKMSPAQAVLQLRFTNTAAAPLLAKAIKTVLANAGNAEGLTFKTIEINDGLKMRRMRVGTAGRGRGRPYKKRMANVKIVLTDDVVAPVQKLNKQSLALGTKAAAQVTKEISEASLEVSKRVTKAVEESTREVKSSEVKEETKG